jgi:hypothetical protein
LKADVSYRLLRVEGKEIQGIYKYKQKDESFYITTRIEEIKREQHDCI